MSGPVYCSTPAPMRARLAGSDSVPSSAGSWRTAITNSISSGQVTSGHSRISTSGNSRWKAASQPQGCDLYRRVQQDRHGGSLPQLSVGHSRSLQASPSADSVRRKRVGGGTAYAAVSETVVFDMWVRLPPDVPSSGTKRAATSTPTWTSSAVGRRLPGSRRTLTGFELPPDVPSSGTQRAATSTPTWTTAP